MEQEILEFLGRVLAYGGGGALVAFGIFRFLGQDRLRYQDAR